MTLEAEAGCKPAGQAGVAFKPASGQGFAELNKELNQLMEMSATEFETELTTSEDSYGYRWATLSDPDLGELVTGVHLLNSTMEQRGYDSLLLCSVFRFRTEGANDLYLVYLYKRAAFYPFAPLPGERRDNELELRVRGIVGGELPIEKDLARWFPLWGIPL